MRIALVSYRSKRHVGGQGVYVRHISRELTRMGHTVEVFSGPPYPYLDEGVKLTKVPSLDLYREPDPFRIVPPWQWRDRIDAEEFLTMCVGAFGEPKSFGARLFRLLKDRRDDFDIIHDNQVVSWGILELKKFGFPLLTTIHHPITADRRIELAQARSLRRKLQIRMWYSFLRMQIKVAPQVGKILTVSENSATDIAADFGVDPANIEVCPLGVDEGFRPPTQPRIPGRLIAMASADAPMKGLATLLEAFAKLRTERDDISLTIVSKPKAGGRTERLISELGIGDSVEFVHGLSDIELVEAMGAAEIGVVPSLYEGFSLPTAELMACATPLVVSRAGAIPEVVGEDGVCADLVTPGDVGELTHALAALLDDPERRARMGAAGRRRVEERFSWHAVAERTLAAYQEVIDRHREERDADR